MIDSRRIALFGGTFDPIHLGHLTIAADAVEAMKLDEVRFLPCRISPHKTDKPPTAPEHRMEMIKIATMRYPWAVADDFELANAGPSYSYLTVAHTREQNPDARIFWLMGCDQWEALPRWKEPEKLAEGVEFIVFPRGGDPRPRSGWRLHALNSQHPASSTQIREALVEGQAPGNWLPAGVLDYIRKNHLYSA
jgi:nicotinate-nucleotide adenylyltransferase